MASPSASSRIVFPTLVLLTTACLAAGQGQPDPVAGLINKHLAEQWKAQKLQPADRTSDAEFIRRLTLDLIGRIPTSDEVQAFENDAAPDKRAKLVDRLLNSEAHAEYSARIWMARLLPSDTPEIRLAQMRLWLTGRLKDNASYKELATQVLTGSGASDSEPQVNYWLFQLGEEYPKAQWPELGRFDMKPATSRTLRVFLGIRMGYDQGEKPEEGQWLPRHFWGINAFLRQVDRETNAKANLVLDLKDNPELNKSGKISYVAGGQNETTEPIYLDGQKIAANWKGTRRQALAELLTRDPHFAKVQVNRVWGDLFGRGLHEHPQVDDFGSRHKVVHAELLDGLARSFVDSGYDVKKLIRAICLSDAYQLKSTTNAANVHPDKEVYFSRMPLRVLRPEQLIESVKVAVGPAIDNRALLASLPRLDRQWEDLPMHERLIHTVSLLNHRDVQRLLNSPDSRIVRDAAKQPNGHAALNQIYLATLGRPASKEEYQRITKALPLQGNPDKGIEPLQDVIWAILNSSEFILNH